MVCGIPGWDLRRRRIVFTSSAHHQQSPELITAIAHALDLFDLPYRIEPPRLRRRHGASCRRTPSRRRFFDIARPAITKSSRLRESGEDSG
jgi:hypothetical protein